MAAKTLAAQYREAQTANLIPTILKTISRVKRATKAIVVLAMATSYMHQVHYLEGLGAGIFAYAPPAIFDLTIYVSLLISQTPGLVREAKRAAIKVLALFTAISMLVNALAPGADFLKVTYVLVVAAIAVVEWLCAKIEVDFTALEAVETAAGPTRTRKLDPAVAAERAAKARITREANRLAQMTPAQRAALTRKAKAAQQDDAELVRMAAGYIPKDAPVSPAPQS